MIVCGADGSGPAPWRVAVVGVGPRGLGVLERTAARLAQHRVGRRVELYAIDLVEPGAGRIWRADQSSCLLMNTPAGEVTMFSGPPDRGLARAGAGPSLAQWWRATRPGDGGGEVAYAPRYLSGRYLRFVLDAVESGLPDNVVLHRVRGCVVAARRAGCAGGWELILDDGRTVEADRVVLTPGHPRPELDDEQRALSQFAGSRPHLQYDRSPKLHSGHHDGLSKVVDVRSGLRLLDPGLPPANDPKSRGWSLLW
ncbi:hypothetical protein GCM10010464_27730 [Pseudonocardia yunnanensis]|uniref:FAD/NAD(P)-binding protein n=1 Tax=Pseudonocardia yunnanensis TaxID=58107 RepID=A0ABW4F2L0_9PSEU